MHEILFRGKRVDNGEFTYGYVVVFNGITQIFVPFTEKEIRENKDHFVSAIGGLWYTVHANTVGQFTGLIDMNHRKIFEGDIVECSRMYNNTLTVESFVLTGNTFNRNLYDYSSEEMAVIGNIYNNDKNIYNTNADRIRAMSDEELALTHSTIFEKACKCKDPSKCRKEAWLQGYSPCGQCVLEWLKQPVI